MLLSGIATSAVVPLFPTYVEAELKRSALFSANLRMIFFILGGLAALPAGALCDSLGRKRTLVIGVTGAVASGLLFMTRSPAALWFLCFYSGLTTGVHSTASQTYLMGSVARPHFGMGSAIYYIGNNLGNAFGSRMAGVLAKEHGYFFMGEVFTALAGLSLLCVWFMLPVLPRNAEGRPSASIWSLAGYARILRDPHVWLLLGIRFFPTFCWGAVSFTIPLVLSRLSHYDPRVPATYQMVYLIVAMCFQLLTGRVCDRFGKKLPVRVVCILLPISVATLALSTGSATACYVFGVINASVAWSLSTIMPGLINDYAREEEKGRVMSLTHLAWSFGMAGGTFMAGLVVERYQSPAAALGIGAVACCLPAVALMIRAVSTRHSASLRP